MAARIDGDLRLEDYVALDGPDGGDFAGTILLVPVERFVERQLAFANALIQEPSARPTPRDRSPKERDETLREMLARVKPLLVANRSDWRDSDKPYTALMADCEELRSQSSVADAVREYLAERPAVREAANMLVTAISMSANADWRRAPDVVRATAARGWFLNRWLPTFLIVDGPIMRFMTSAVWKGREKRPESFIAARNLLGDRTFVAIRNAFAHWSFGWETIKREHWIAVYDERTGIETLRFHQRQGDALHMIAWAVVDVLNQVFFRDRPSKAE